MIEVIFVFTLAALLILLFFLYGGVRFYIIQTMQNKAKDAELKRQSEEFDRNMGEFKTMFGVKQCPYCKAEFEEADMITASQLETGVYCVTVECEHCKEKFEAHYGFVMSKRIYEPMQDFTPVNFV